MEQASLQGVKEVFLSAALQHFPIKPLNISVSKKDKCFALKISLPFPTKG